MSTIMVMECYKSVAMSHGRRKWSLLFTFAGRCYNWAFSGEEHMRDEHGCSVSPSHLSSLALWVK